MYTSKCVLGVTTFTIDNLEMFQTTQRCMQSALDIYKIFTDQLLIWQSIRWEVCCVWIKLYDTLQLKIKRLFTACKQFKAELKEFVLTHSLYYVVEFRLLRNDCHTVFIWLTVNIV